jgi:hypothetical protein
MAIDVRSHRSPVLTGTTDGRRPSGSGLLTRSTNSGPARTARSLTTR